MTDKKITNKANALLDKALQVRKEVLKRNEENYLEVVGEVDEVIFINNARSTEVASTSEALNAIEAPIVLITGGITCKSDYAEVAEAFAQKVEVVIYTGNEPEKMLENFSNTFVLFVAASDLMEAVNTANFCSKPGNVVLYSPACNVKELDANGGVLFKELVAELKK